MKDTMLIRLYILSRMLDAPTNPYRIFKEYQGSQTGRFQPIEEAKFYYNIDLLHKQDYISQTSIVPGDNAPSKKMYAVTPKGREFFEDALYKRFAGACSVDDLYLIFPFLEFVDTEKARNILGKRIAELERELENILQAVCESFIVEYAIEKRRFHLKYLKKAQEFIGQAQGGKNK
ncbi:Transcriptional regulator PadR-like family protein [Sporobacter termitidis DSM 10068]|uniref:Transcriptional regulator PadR-like family protein n=1 Tax=Sporobacter termitidis DSM 10068 TaxID=1123282 RepID=A0A1M5XSR5_9FIRM|nr:PadR family transcriptional regulator [Sporobacter termitidis]SHI02799.1 Transcriptional regulator PadR-like family protein [Sporobacter termitidis DSM 10068]